MKVGMNVIVALILSTSLSVSAESLVTELSKKSYLKHSGKFGIVLFSASWTRVWNCGGFENAELRELGFDALSEVDGNPDLLVKGKSGHQDYAYIVSPGVYALTRAKVKMAAAMGDVRYLELDESFFVKSGEPVGGSFEVAAGEAVYIGHFALDCTYQPIPWRYYLEPEGDFEKYIENFRTKHHYVDKKAITYRLFKTKEFGENFEPK